MPIQFCLLTTEGLGHAAASRGFHVRGGEVCHRQNFLLEIVAALYRLKPHYKTDIFLWLRAEKRHELRVKGLCVGAKSSNLKCQKRELNLFTREKLSLWLRIGLIFHLCLLAYRLFHCEIALNKSYVCESIVKHALSIIIILSNITISASASAVAVFHDLSRFVRLFVGW